MLTRILTASRKQNANIEGDAMNTICGILQEGCRTTSSSSIGRRCSTTIGDLSFLEKHSHSLTQQKLTEQQAGAWRRRRRSGRRRSKQSFAASSESERWAGSQALYGKGLTTTTPRPGARRAKRECVACFVPFELRAPLLLVMACLLAPDSTHDDEWTPDTWKLLCGAQNLCCHSLSVLNGKVCARHKSVFRKKQRSVELKGSGDKVIRNFHFTLNPIVYNPKR